MVERLSTPKLRIIDGVFEIIKEERCLIKETPANFDANKVVSRIYKQLVANLNNSGDRFRTVGPSKKNWRFEKMRKMPKNDSSKKQKEKKLERTIVNLDPPDFPSSPDWVNQVPTSLGLIRPRSGAMRNIDLVHRRGKEAYEFIELKVGSDTPMYAAFEIVVNGLIYLVSREFYTNQCIDSKEILKARKVHLQTLAPHGYYSGYSLSWLENELNRGLKTFASEKFNNNFEIDFTFTSFPESFVWPCKDNELVDALNNRISVY